MKFALLALLGSGAQAAKVAIPWDSGFSNATAQAAAALPGDTLEFSWR